MNLGGEMNTVEQLKLERNGRTVPLARFYEDYKTDASNICYGFVEGKDDPSYYRPIINNLLPQGCYIILYPSNGKENVKYIYEEISKRGFQHNRISFFMDRDLSCIVEDPNLIKDDPNVYITDNYSIENDILSDDTLGNILDIIGLTTLSVKDTTAIKELFVTQKGLFEQGMKFIMANIILWKRENLKPSNYNNLKVKDLIKIERCKVSFVPQQEMIDVLYKQSNMQREFYDEHTINKILIEIDEKNLAQKITRGKYLSSFFIEFCNSLSENSSEIGFPKPHKRRLLCNNDIIDIIAPRSKPPQSLKCFITDIIVPAVT